MTQLYRLFCKALTRGLGHYKRRGGGFGKALAVFVLVLLLTFSSVSLAQRGGGAREPVPPRPKQAVKPWPWLLAFVLLGLAWYPAFKNSRRELSKE